MSTLAVFICDRKTMPNQKTSKGKRNKRTNSSGDEQENGASGGTHGGATALSGATVGPCKDNNRGGEKPLMCWQLWMINVEY